MNQVLPDSPSRGGSVVVISPASHSAAAAIVVDFEMQCIENVDDVIVAVRAEDYPSLAAVWENDEDDAPHTDAAV